MHEPPTVLNWPAPDRGSDQRLHAGLVLTIEPMLTAGRTRLVTEAEGWTISALDGSPSAHEEHTIMVAGGGPVVLTRH
jgi:methionyl aminopeptidase